MRKESSIKIAVCGDIDNKIFGRETLKISECQDSFINCDNSRHYSLSTDQYKKGALKWDIKLLYSPLFGEHFALHMDLEQSIVLCRILAALLFTRSAPYTLG